MPKEITFDTELVLKQATSIFHKKGYHGTSMQDITDITGLNRSSIYNTFGCKLQLYLATLSNYQQTTNSKTNAKISQETNALSSLQTLLDFYVTEIINDKDNKGCFIVNCKSEMANQEFEITKFLNSNQTENLIFFERLVQLGQQEHVFNTLQAPKSYALYLLSSLQGLRMSGILIKEKQQLESITRSIIQTLT